MKKSLLTIGVATTLMIAWSIGRVQGQQGGKVVFASPDQAAFHEMGKGPSMAAIWGDVDQGA
jgi:enoyl-[acyl-carrier-protein] reductase (NADH)